MLTEKEIREALHASRVLPIAVANPHGPLGLEELASAVALAASVPPSASPADSVQRPLKLSTDTWQKLDVIARAATGAGTRRLSASDVAAALIERSVKAG
jgi:hypothetical protein